MRTIVDIPESDIAILDKISSSKNISRAAIIREAISKFLQQTKDNRSNQAFGILKRKKIDGLKYQMQIRDEWE